MLDEGSGVMEKKIPPRQSPSQPKNNGVISEKKSDYVSNKGGRQRNYKQSNNGGRSQELAQTPKPVQKYTQSYGDKRPRPRGYFNDRQSEEVVEANDDIFIADGTNSRKGNANYLLKFSFAPSGENGQYDTGRGSGWRFGRSGYGPRRKTFTTRYSPEQFLQASCQFIVTEGGEYTEQAINPDALVNWDMVEQVRTFSVEPVVCPICLQQLYAGKITKCGHVYCWSCILHHLQEKEIMCRTMECPICPHRIDPEELKSVLCVETSDYKVGDFIELKLMRKSKGSVYVCPKSQWTDREGVPHNIDDGTITQYMKLLSATYDQIQKQIIQKEKDDLDELLQTAEGYETCYIDIAKNSLERRENNLKMKFEVYGLTESEKLRKLTDQSYELVKSELEVEMIAEPAPISADDTEIIVQYADAFEDEKGLPIPNILPVLEFSSEAFPPGHDAQDIQSLTIFEDGANSFPNSPALTLPLKSQQFEISGHLTPEEAADHLELPEGGGGSYTFEKDSIRNKDTYYFYQASSGQHIYLSSLNAQCLTKEYGSLENSPEVIEAQIVAIERIFMNEDVRKRLRYLNHIPLTCEFHVVELKFQQPLVSRETLQHFQPEFDKRRKARMRKKKEEKDRAKQQEVEHKASFGIYPEVQIPLDNLAQFPAHLGNPSSSIISSAVLVAGTRHQSDSESGRADSFSESGSQAGNTNSPRQRNDSTESQTGLVSFAQMLKAGKSVPHSAVWGRAVPQEGHLHISATMPELSSPPGRYTAADDDDGGEYLPAPPIASSWFDDISKAMDAHTSRHQAQEALDVTDASLDTRAGGAAGAGGGRKKKTKKKEKQLLFSTSMARKG
uniref:E3 ubiquitin-protein ligase RNF10 n=1 Tax=Arion vulgaris TaxID=1028688 RepID=A0A0B7ALL1_9EUPU